MSRRPLFALVLTILAVAAVLAARRSGGPLESGVPSYRISGPADAPVTIVAFSDFQCPNCAKAEPIMKGLLDRHPGKIRLFFRHNPLKRHPWSVPAARAAEAAGLQGKFWEYHDLLFTRQTDWGKPESPDPRDLFLGYARELGLDMDRFAADSTSGRWDGLLIADKRAVEAGAVSATPTFFIGEERRVGAGQLEADGERLVALGGG